MTNDWKRHFGSIRRLPSGSYQAVYTHEGLRHTAPGTFATKAAALGYLASVETSIGRGQWIDPSLGSMTFATLASIWTESNQTKTHSSVLRDQGILEKHVLPTFAEKKLTSISQGQVQGLVNEWTRSDLAPRTVRRHYAVVKAIFSFAVRSDFTSRSPCRSINLPRVTDEFRHQLSVDDIERLAQAIAPRYSLMIYLGAVLGMRWGEVAGTKFRAIDTKSGTIAIREQVVVARGGGSELGPPKSRAGVRVLAIPSPLMHLMLEHVSALGLGPEDLLFTTESGRLLNYSNWHQRFWSPARSKCGLQVVGFHDLRRANATALVAGGVDVKTTQTRLGHSDSRLTLEVYAQATSDGDRRASDVAANELLSDRLRTDCARSHSRGRWSTRKAVKELEPERRVELLTYALRVRCSTN
jgi:integrase